MLLGDGDGRWIPPCVCGGDIPESTIEGRGLVWEHPHHNRRQLLVDSTEMQRIRFSQRAIVMLGGPLIVHLAQRERHTRSLA